ncbi:MAG: hypothetical protein KGJ39_05350 [Acidobacteriota bacterium]|nr:hypothetical protein [Acidobacteriota bacterium]
MEHRGRESGIALVATLAALIIVAILVVIVLAQTSKTPSVSVAPGTTLAGTSAGRAAAQATCLTNFEEVGAALNAYVTRHGTYPPAGTAWATRSSSPLLRAWPSQPGYAITWNGVALGVRPAHGAAVRGSEGEPSRHNGCYAN